jgi:hypothetical protein
MFNIPIASQVARGKPLASGCYAFGHWLHHPATGAPKASRAVFLYSLGNVVLGVVNAKQAIYQSCAVGAVVQGTGLDGAFERGRIQKGTSGLREPRPEGAEGSGEGCRATFEHPQRPTFDGEIAGNDRSDLGDPVVLKMVASVLTSKLTPHPEPFFNERKLTVNLTGVNFAGSVHP